MSTLHRKTLRTVLLGSLLVQALPGCGSNDSSVGPGPSGSPSLSMSLSKTSDLSPGEVITATVSVTDFTLNGGDVGGANVAGSGHYHVYWDNASGTTYMTAGASAETPLTVPQAASGGSHLIRVELFNDDHTPLSPVVDTQASVTVKTASGPSLTETLDKTSGLNPGDVVTVGVTVTGFKLDGTKVGKSNEQNVGHYHLYWDDDSGASYLTVGVDPQVKATIPADASPGTHFIAVELFNNDHTPLSPPVKSVAGLEVM
jgi:hypothetical protein